MRSVVLTGVSRGLGAALFDEFVAHGDRVLALGRRFTGTQRALADAEPTRVRLYPLDLASPADRVAFVTSGLLRDAMRGARAAVLMNNAGVLEPIGTVGTVGDADLARSAAVNLVAPMALTTAFLAARPAGLPTTVVYVSSSAATAAVPTLAAYCATKAGAEMFFRVVAAEHPQVRVACVDPGRLDTGMQALLRGPAFPGAAERIEIHQRGELADPAVVARSIIESHLTDG